MKVIKTYCGKDVLVSNSDYLKLKTFRWHLSRGYAVTYVLKNGKATYPKIHQIIYPSRLSDHRNGNILDNRRCNLRAATPLENKRNRGLNKNSSTGFKGVYFHKTNKKFCAQVSGVFIGCFETKEDAARAYNKEARKMFGRFCRTNPV